MRREAMGRLGTGTHIRYVKRTVSVLLLTVYIEEVPVHVPEKGHIQS